MAKESEEKKAKDSEAKKAKYEPPKVHSIGGHQLFAEQSQGDYGDPNAGWYANYPAWGQHTPCYSVRQDFYNRNPDGSRIPICDVDEDDILLVVSIELPGAKRDEVELSVSPTSLSVTAQSTEDGRDLHFHGILQLNEEVVTEQTEAQYLDGLLTVKLPKLCHVKSKTVEIK